MKEKSETRTKQKLFTRKQRFIAFSIIALAFILGGVIVALPRNSAARAANPPHLLVLPPSANYSPQILMRVAGSYFPKNEKVQIYWNYTGPGTGTLEGTATADPKGAFVLRFPMPLVPTGIYTVAAIGLKSGIILTGTTHILPALSLTPRGAGAGTVAHIYGNAFGANETVNIYWDSTGPGTGTLVASPTSDATGSFTIPLTIPTSLFWNIPVVATGVTSGASAHFGFILYHSMLTLAPLSGSANTSVTVSSFGFQAIEKVKVFWNNGATPVASATTNQNGYLAPLTFTIPSGTAPGSYTVSAVGAKSNLTIINSFVVVAPASTLSSASGPVGASIPLSGSGYTPGETVNVLWNYTGPGAGTTVATVTAGISGAFATSFIAPTSATGSYPVAVIGATSHSITNHSFIIANSLAINPATSSPGTNVTASGTGFSAGESVQLFLDIASGTLLTTTTADGNGNINASVALPTSITAGAHQIVGVGQTSALSFASPVTIDTNWGDFGFNTGQNRLNPSEYGVSNSNVSSLQSKWSASAIPLLQQSAVYANGTVYTGTQKGVIYAFDAITGNQKWKYDTRTGFEITSAPLIDPINNLVFFGTVDFDNSGSPSPFYALNASTGALVWSVILPWNNTAPPSLAFNTIYMGASSIGGNTNINAIDEFTGHTTWQHTVPGSVWGAIAVDVNTNTAFVGVGNPSNQVVALNATTGVQQWVFAVPNSDPAGDVRAGIVVNNNLVFVDSGNGNLYALHESDGTLIWTAPAGPADDGNLSSPVIGPDGTLYIGSMDGNLYAFNSTTGALVWKTSVGAGIASSPALANGVVYFTSLNKSVYAVDASAGNILWSYTMGAQSYASPIMANGWLYAASADGKVYAFSL